MSDNLTLSEIIRLGIQRELANLHTSMPGRVEAYDSETRLAKVKPLLRRLYAGEDQAVDLPVISNVPVMHFRANKSQVSLPIKPGDTVLLVFCERAIDRWLELGGVVDPQDPAMHALNEAVAVPGLYPKGQSLSLNGSPDSVEIANGSSYIEIEEDGKILIKASGAVTLNASQINLGDENGEALALKSDLAKLTYIAPLHPGSPTPVNASAAIGTIKVKAS